MSKAVFRDQQQTDPVANVEGDADGSVSIIHHLGWLSKSEICVSSLLGQIVLK